MRKIVKIHHTMTDQLTKRKRVAAYARVSSGKDAMLHSLSAQISYFNSYIEQHSNWVFAGVYADEAITGTKDGRPEFQRMLSDCRAGKIDVILTKSISRFARNTLTLLETIRELKLLGIDVFFERENIHSLSSDGELLLTVLASFAQEESRSASENQKWRIRKMFEKGHSSTGNMLGYRLKLGNLCIVPEEAELVRTIFSDYLSGMSFNAITKKLNHAKIPSFRGGKWIKNSIRYILCNEKYTGDMLLQKTYRLDHISKKKLTNRGEFPMYRVANSHEAIISKDVFELVQKEIQRRATQYPQQLKPSKQYLFTHLIRCGLCGKYYRHKMAGSERRYRKPVWICATFNTHGKNVCPSQQIPESILIAKTMKVLEVTELNVELIQKQIEAIIAPMHNKLIYVMKDGQRKEIHWQNPSRKESWTEEMKQAARERQLNINRRRAGK